MNRAIGAVLPFAVGAAVSPIPLVAAIAVLFTRRARTNGVAYLLGWSGGSSVVVAAAYFAAHVVDLGGAGDDTAATSGVRTGLGVVLLLLAVRKWRSRPAAGEATTPGWMARIDEFGTGRIAGLGALLSINPKNVLLAIGAATALARTDGSTTEVIVGLVVFVVLGSAGVIAAVGYAVIGGDRSRATLERTREWMIVNNAAVMATLFLVFGAVLVAQGLSGS